MCLYDFDLQMSNDVLQLGSYSTLFIISGVSIVQLEHNPGVSFLQKSKLEGVSILSI